MQGSKAKQKKASDFKPRKSRTGEGATSSVGMRELKNRTSAIIGRVERSRKSLLVRRNKRLVARIEPVEELEGDSERADLLGEGPKGRLNEVSLHPIELDSSLAIESILSDREE